MEPSISSHSSASFIASADRPILYLRSGDPISVSLISRVNTVPGVPRQDRGRPCEDEVRQAAPAVPQPGRKRRVLLDDHRTDARRRGAPEAGRRHHRPGASRRDALQLDDEGHHRLPHRRHESRPSKSSRSRGRTAILRSNVRSPRKNRRSSVLDFSQAYRLHGEITEKT